MQYAKYIKGILSPQYDIFDMCIVKDTYKHEYHACKARYVD